MFIASFVFICYTYVVLFFVSCCFVTFNPIYFHVTLLANRESNNIQAEIARSGSQGSVSHETVIKSEFISSAQVIDGIYNVEHTYYIVSRPHQMVHRFVLNGVPYGLMKDNKYYVDNTGSVISLGFDRNGQ